ncbi:GAF domain-containing protein [Streptomyces sp. NPDC102467]|uniref:GAF domain-containing protein n=1 Tax=Streptomyces sp. NPDC102467 TaxID=3366179 RepID=UPI0038306AE6
MTHDLSDEASAQELLVDALLALTGPRSGAFDPHAHAGLLLRHSLLLVDAASVGVELADTHHRLHSTLASTTTGATFADDPEHAGGPSRRAFTSGRPVTAVDLQAEDSRGPAQRAPAAVAGFCALHAVPLINAGRILGVLVFYRDTPAPFTLEDCAHARALADIAAIALAFHHVADQQHDVIAHLARVHDVQIVTEQAKGILAARLHLAIPEADTMLHHQAHMRGLAVYALARVIVAGVAWPPLDRTD